MNLKSYRALCNMTQRQLASRLDVTELSVIKYESGAVLPGREVMLKIYALTGGAVTPNDFYELDSVALTAAGGKNMDTAEKDTFVSLGLMSGTSMDGIDAGLVSTDGEGMVKEIGDFSLRYDPEMKMLLKSAERAVRSADGDLVRAESGFAAAAIAYIGEASGLSAAEAERSFTELSRYIEGKSGARASLSAVIARSTDLHARAVRGLLESSGYKPRQVDVIGYHGQTLFHRPKAGLTVQAGDGRRLADTVEIPVVYDFRSNDVRNGGEGAPFAPLYHAALARQIGLAPLVIANCGGIANITVVTGRDEDLCAFDTGPGNALIDRFVKLRVGKPCDEDGRYGLQGKVDERCLARLRATSLEQTGGGNYLDRLPPKSLDVNDMKLVPELEALSLQDGAATLEAFTAECIVDSLRFLEAKSIEVPRLWVVAGGGWKNPVIFRELSARLRARLGADLLVRHAGEVGWNGTALEAQIFAYLAVRALKGLPLSVPGTTGVPKPQSGGKLALPKGASRSGKKARAMAERGLCEIAS